MVCIKYNERKLSRFVSRPSHNTQKGWDNLGRNEVNSKPEKGGITPPKQGLNAFEITFSYDFAS
jgi:hypothetical protein